MNSPPNAKKYLRSSANSSLNLVDEGLQTGTDISCHSAFITSLWLLRIYIKCPCHKLLLVVQTTSGINLIAVHYTPKDHRYMLKLGVVIRSSRVHPKLAQVDLKLNINYIIEEQRKCF